MKPLSPCPHCKKSNLVYSKGQTVEHLEILYNSCGEKETVNLLDSYKELQVINTIRCLYCRKLRTDLKVENGNVIEKGNG